MKPKKILSWIIIAIFFALSSACITVMAGIKSLIVLLVIGCFVGALIWALSTILSES